MWQPFEMPEGDTPLLALQAGRVLLTVRAYAFGQRRIQVSIDHGFGYFLGMTWPEL